MTPGLMFTSDAINELATSLAAAQGEIKDASKDSLNPHLKSKYADLAEVLQTARPTLSKHGLSVVQGVAFDNGQVHVTTRLLHKSGQFVESMISIPVAKADAQGVGAATTYGRRYGLAAMIGISQDDDDGESIKAPQRKPRESNAGTGSTPQTQGPLNGRLLDPGPVAQAMIERFNSIQTSAGEPLMKALTEEYASLTPVEQNQVLPAAKAARARLEGAKSKPTQ